MSSKTKLSANFKIYVPKAVRDKMQWHAGQKLAFVQEEAGVRIMIAHAENKPVALEEGPEAQNAS
jgi:AbrB family looped-hinge helix DNA binding protein